MARSYHRDWLHALEDDRAVPAYALQAARVYADFAAGSGERGVHVSFRMLLHTTHLRRTRAAQAIAWLRDRGWLEVAEAGNGRRSYYFLRVRGPSEPVPNSGPVPPPVPVPPAVPEPVPPPVLRTSTSDRKYLDAVTSEV